MKSRRVFSTRSVSVRSRSTATAPPPGIGAAVTSNVRPGRTECARAEVNRLPSLAPCRASRNPDHAPIPLLAPADADVLWDKPFHASICPLHLPVRSDRDHRVLHGIEKRFELALALLHGRETVFQAPRRFVESGRNLPDLIRRIRRDACAQIPGRHAFRKRQDSPQASGRVVCR